MKNFIIQHFWQDPSFILLVPFPRKEFRDHMLKMTLQEADLTPRGSLTVQTISEKGVIRKAFEKDESELDTDQMTYEVQSPKT